MEVKNKICAVLCAFCSLISTIMIMYTSIIDGLPPISYLGDYSSLIIFGLVISLLLIFILLLGSAFSDKPDKSLFIANIVASVSAFIVFAILTYAISEIPLYPDQEIEDTYSVILLGLLYVLLASLAFSAIFCILDLHNKKYVEEKIEQKETSATDTMKTTTPTETITPSIQEEPKEELLIRLDRLKSLKEQGYITDEEYEAKRKEIIANTKF